MGPALLVAILVMPAYGASLFALDRVPAVWAQDVVVRAAWVYGAFVSAGAALVVVLDTPSLPIAAPGVAGAVAVALAVPCALLAYFTELAVSQATGATSPSLPDGRSASRAVAEVADRPGGFLVLATLTAITEEVLFRGHVLPELRATHGGLVALGATSAIFAFHHAVFGVPAVAGKFVAGALWGALALLGGSVLASIASHLVFQALVHRRMRRLP